MEIYEMIAVILLIVLSIAFIVRMVRDEKQEVKNWLLIAVEEAERKLGAGTGKRKLEMVYNMFSDRFPVLSVFLSFETFSGWVDIALEQMKEVIEKIGKDRADGKD